MTKRKDNTKYILPLGLAVIAGLVLMSRVSALPPPNGGGGNAAPSGTIEIVVQPARLW